MARLAVLAALVAAASHAGACSTDEDCSLLGVCADGLCACDDGWTGPDCARADLEPWSEGDGYFNSSFASWGGRALLAEDGSWHLFATEIAMGCPLILFMNDSTVVRAVSRSGPTGPFEHVETVLPTFHHNPTIVGPTPDGYYLLAYIGADTPAETRINCAAHGVPTERWRPLSNGISSMAWSKSLEGPWEQRVVLQRNHDGNLSRWDCQNNNPSLTVLPNGTVVMIYRANSCEGNSGEALGLAIAEHWGADFVRHEEPILRPEDGFGNNEDPFLWVDAKGNFHIVAHEQSTNNVCGSNVAGHTCGAHLFSRDGFSWTVSRTPVYDSAVTLANGTTGELQTRQRPQIVFDANGAPLVLYNGASFEGNNPDTDILTHTFAFRFKSRSRPAGIVV